MGSNERQSGGGMSRRSYLGIVAATVSSQTTGSATASGKYEHVVDIVEAGADNTGREPIDDVFHDHAADDTLIEFPEGTYRANKLGLYRLSHFAMVGDDATLVPGDDYDRGEWIAGAETDGLRIENFTIDNTQTGKAPKVHVSAYDRLVVRDVHKKGYQDAGGTAFNFWILDSDGTGLLERISAPDGGEGVGIYIHGDCKGAMTVRNCRIEYFENNGLYGSYGTAPVGVEGGTFRNNNVAQVRLGSPGSYVKDATLVVDEPVPPDRDVINMRGVRIADGPGPVTVEDCDITMKQAEGSGAVVGAYDGGSFDVRNTRIYVGEDYTTIGSDGSRTSRGVFVDDATEEAPGERTFENVSITGGGTFRSAMLLRRSDNTVRNCCIHQSGTGRNGITLENSKRTTVEDTTLAVPDEEIRLRDSSVRRAGISTDGTCPGPEGGATGSSDSGITGEVGSVTVDQPGPDEWHTVGLEGSYDRPVAVAKPVSHNGPDPCHVRLRDVSTDKFAFHLEEWLYLDGAHQSERADHLVLEAGTYRVDDLAIEAGYVETDHWFRPIEFDQDFERTPVVFAQPSTYNGPNPVVTRLRDVSTRGAYVTLAEEEGEEHDGAHRTETVGYVAVEPGTGTLDGRPFEVGCCLEVDGDWQRVEFHESYDDPRILADVQTYNGPDTANLRYRNLTGSGVEVVVEEERSTDDEVGHVSERVGVLVVD